MQPISVLDSLPLCPSSLVIHHFLLPFLLPPPPAQTLILRWEISQTIPKPPHLLWVIIETELVAKVHHTDVLRGLVAGIVRNHGRGSSLTESASVLDKLLENIEKCVLQCKDVGNIDILLGYEKNRGKVLKSI